MNTAVRIEYRTHTAQITILNFRDRHTLKAEPELVHDSEPRSRRLAYTMSANSSRATVTLLPPVISRTFVESLFDAHSSIGGDCPFPRKSVSKSHNGSGGDGDETSAASSSDAPKARHGRQTQCASVPTTPLCPLGWYCPKPPFLCRYHTLKHAACSRWSVGVRT